MRYKVRVTVIDKKQFPEYTEHYCTEPGEDACPCYHVGDEFLFDPDRNRNCIRNCGLNTLIRTSADPRTAAGGPVVPHCSLAWEILSRCVGAGLAGGSVSGNGSCQGKAAVLACPDGTHPVLFRIERLDAEEAPSFQFQHSTAKADSGDASRSEKREDEGLQRMR